MKLSEMLNDVEVEKTVGSADINIAGIAFNSSEVKAGYVFVCIKGFKTDGHIYAADALDKGAVAIIAEREMPEIAANIIVVKNSRYALAKISAAFYGYPYKRFKLIGITGTNGKTTTTYLIKSVLEQKGFKVGLIGTNQNMVGQTVIPSHHTTPDSLELMKLFAKMADEGAEYVVMEVSSHSLALDRVAACEFSVGAITNVTQDHLDFHKTMENYMAAKAKLFKMCEAGIVNADDASESVMRKAAECPVISYGLENAADVKASDVLLSSKGVDFDVYYKSEKQKIKLGIPGRFSVYNALTATSCLLALGFSLEEIAAALENAKGVKGRIEVVPVHKDYTVIIDYAHTPDGLLNIIKTIRGFAEGRVITLFGCGGDRDKTKRPIMGEIAGKLSDYCIVTSDNPRSEDPGEIIKDILAGISKTDCEYKVIENRFDAIEYALDNAKEKDIVLLAGKGHETYQILKDRTIVFDEREIVMKLLQDTIKPE